MSNTSDEASLDKFWVCLVAGDGFGPMDGFQVKK